MATLKQKIAVKEITENHRSVSSAMRVAGYDEDTVVKPSNLTDSKGFKELMNKLGITDEKLAKVLDRGLEDNDSNTRHKYLETGLRLKGYGKETPAFNLNFNSNKYVQH